MTFNLSPSGSDTTVPNRSVNEAGPEPPRTGKPLMAPYYDQDGITIYHGDCREILPLLVEVDLVFADPPYGVGLSYASHDDRHLGSLDWLEMCRALAPTIVTPGYVNLYDYPRPNYTAIRYDRTAQSPAGIAWMNKWEPVLFYGKFAGRLPWDVIETATQTERKREPLDHLCPKTVSLLRALLDPLTTPGGLVVDPFFGSGTTGKAARELGLRCIGIEIEEKYCEIAVQRLAQGVLAL